MSALITDHYDTESPEAKQCMSQPLGVHTLAGSPTNPRKSFPADEMESLTNNVKQHGILQPILVRLWPHYYPWQGKMPLYEIVCGERRWRAATAAGLHLIPGVVRNLTDKEVVALQIIENLQRKDISPLEEAFGYKKMMSEHGYSADDIAKSVNKSKAYVYASLKLTDLCPEGQEALNDGRLNPSVALLVARIPVASLQAKAVAEVTKPHWNGDLPSVRDAKKTLQERYMLDLGKAPFPLDDATIKPDAGSCADCPHRTGNQTEFNEDIGGADVCTVPDCLGEKKSLWVAIKIKRAEEEGLRVIQGQEAKRIAPYGVGDHSCLNGGFVQLDAKCYSAPSDEAGKVQTYRQLLAGETPIVEMLSDGNGQLVEIVSAKDTISLLAERGIDIRISESHNERNKEEEKKAKRENAYRWELLVRINHTCPTGVFDPSEEQKVIAEVMFKRTEHNDKARLVRLYGYEGKEAHKDINALEARIPDMPGNELLLLMVNLALIGEANVQAGYNYGEPKRMQVIAEKWLLDPAAIRAKVEAQLDEKTKKPKTPSKAARAEEPSAPVKAESQAAATPEAKPAKPAPMVTKAPAKSSKTSAAKAPAAKKAAQAQKPKAQGKPKSRGQASLAKDGKSKSSKVMNEKPKGKAAAGAVDSQPAVPCDKTVDMFQGGAAA